MVPEQLQLCGTGGGQVWAVQQGLNQTEGDGERKGEPCDGGRGLQWLQELHRLGLKVCSDHNYTSERLSII